MLHIYPIYANYVTHEIWCLLLPQNDVDRVYEDLEVETRALQQERGRQERLAASLSDQMYLEAQVSPQIVTSPV